MPHPVSWKTNITVETNSLGSTYSGLTACDLLTQRPFASVNIALEALPKHCPWKKILEAKGNKLPVIRKTWEDP